MHEICESCILGSTELFEMRANTCASTHDVRLPKYGFELSV